MSLSPFLRDDPVFVFKGARELSKQFGKHNWDMSVSGCCVQIVFCVSEKQLLGEGRERLGTARAQILWGEEGRKGDHSALQGPGHLGLGQPRLSLRDGRVWTGEAP